MTSKLLHKLTDENTDLHKQTGCMNGLFQIFDRHQFLTGRRRVKNQKKIPPIPGQNGNHGVEANSTERSWKKVAKEKKRVSTESSRTSFSSSSCSSSFSSLECNRITQLEPSSYGCGYGYGKNKSSDLQDVVKDSVFREGHALSVKTVTKEEAQGHIFKHVDSPRPLQLLKPAKRRNSSLSESFHGKEEKDHSRLLTTRDAAPRFSFDGRESRDTLKSLKIKELPRLSLDSRERTARAPNHEMKSSYFVQQELESYKRSSSVVAKLMGLEAFPGDTLTNENQTGLIKRCPEKKVESISRSSHESKRNHMLGSPRNSHKDSISPRMGNADSVPTPSSKFPIEPAPRKQTDVRLGSQVPGLKHQVADTKVSNSAASVYGEIEKRLADIEFKKSGKDLRALKRILEAMQKTAEMSEIKKDMQVPNRACQTDSNCNLDQSSKVSNQRNLQSSNSATCKGNSSPRNFRSTNLITKLTDRANNTASLMTSTDSISGGHKYQTCTKGSNDRQPVTDLTQRGNNKFRDPSMDINTRAQTSRSMQMLKGPRTTAGETACSGTVSPRLQRTKNGVEKQSCVTIPSSDSSITRRQVVRQPIESGSSGRKLKPSTPNSHQSSSQLKEKSSSIRDLRKHGGATFQQSESSSTSASHIETNASSTKFYDRNNCTTFQHYGQKQKNLKVKFIAGRAVAEHAVVTSEQPSPISVLNAFYRDESPSPVKKIKNVFKDIEALNSDQAECPVVDLNHQPQTSTLNLSFKNDQNESENIQHLVSNLRQDESINKYVTALRGHSNPDHVYISKILFVSGLLKDLDSGVTSIPFHPSGHPINPNMFLAVEESMASIGLSNAEYTGQSTSHKNSVEKIHRKLIFDVINEILGHMLAPEDCFGCWFSPNKFERGRLKGQQLLRDLCSEIDQLQASKSSCSSEDEDNNLTSIPWEDLMHQSANWSNYPREISGLVLNIESLIFKDLISEFVNGETVGLKAHSGRYCRQLFST